MADAPDRILDDWLKAYMIYTHPTEPPEIYHLWTGICAIAGAMRRRTYIGFSHFNLYPNHYVVLAGAAGTMKSSSMRIGRELLQQVPAVKFSVESITRERLIQDLSQSYSDGASAMTAYCSEFGSFFSSSGPEMAVFLTDIYESPVSWSHSSKTGGTNTIKAPCLNLQAGTTPESIEKALPLQAIGLGLTSRIVFVHAELPRERDWRTKKTGEQLELEKYLVHDLHIISTLQGEFEFTPEADSEYNEWNKKCKQNPYENVFDDRLKPYYARKHTHILKLCMILSASRGNSLVVTQDDLHTAHGILAQAEEVMHKAFAGVGASELASPMEKVIGLLEHALQPMPYDAILKHLRRDVRREELDEILSTLELTGSLVKVPNMQKPGTFLYKII